MILNGYSQIESDVGQKGEGLIWREDFFCSEAVASNKAKLMINCPIAKYQANAN